MIDLGYILAVAGILAAVLWKVLLVRQAAQVAVPAQSLKL